MICQKDTRRERGGGAAGGPVAGERRLSARRARASAGRSAGFTLMEVTAVLVVLGIVAAVAISRFSTGNASAVSEAEIFKSCLRYAQIRAMGDISTWGITFDSSSTYRLFTNNASVTPLLPGIGSASRTMPDGVKLSVTNAVSGSGLGSIIFDYRGRPVASGGPNDAAHGKEYQKNDSSKWPAVRTANTTVTFTKEAAVTVTVSQQTGFAQ